MPATIYRGRRAAAIENDRLRVTVLQEGGHIAEVLDKRTGVNPLWTPPWPTIEPSSYSLANNPEYGSDAESKLLAGIMGHNVCLDIFGGPSSAEAAAGITVHGEGSIAPYEIAAAKGRIEMRARLPLAQLHFERSIELQDGLVRVRETLGNLTASDRPIAWTQHVTLGPPFLEKGNTQFRASATRSKVSDLDFGPGAYLKTGALFDWPMAPRFNGSDADLRVMDGAAVSAGFTTHVMDEKREDAFFIAFAPALGLAFGYIWKRADFPWLGIWEENGSRTGTPWNRKTITRGMEFGVSPFAETRREMVDRSQLFGLPTYRWLPAKSRLEVEYWIIIQTADRIPESLSWPSSE